MFRFRNILLILLALFLVSQFYIYFNIYPADSSPGGYVVKLAQILSTFLGQTPQKVVRINLATHTLNTFANGRFVKRYEIAGMGHPRISPTPQGSFSILQKREKIFSGLSRVWMPWSLRFHGAYYIHGIPYYPSGALIQTPYSLGCIRLPTNQAQEFFQWADLGTKVEIYNAHVAKSTDKPTVYQLFKDGSRKQIDSPQALFSLGYQWKDVAIISEEELNAYSGAYLIRKEWDHRVYLIENRIKRWIKTAAAFERLGYSWQQISLITDQEFNAYPIGENIE